MMRHRRRAPTRRASMSRRACEPPGRMTPGTLRGFRSSRDHLRRRASHSRAPHRCLGIRASMPRIEDYAIIGDTQTAALVSRDGAIDWASFPRFDSESCFAALLGEREHGRWSIAPAVPVRKYARRYRPGTLVLETEFETDEGAVRVIDFMPVRGQDPDLVRVVEGLRGRVPMRFDLVIRFDTGRIVPWVRKHQDALLAVAGPNALCLRSDLSLHGQDLATVAEFTIAAGERRST